MSTDHHPRPRINIPTSDPTPIEQKKPPPSSPRKTASKKSSPRGSGRSPAAKHPAHQFSLESGGGGGGGDDDLPPPVPVDFNQECSTSSPGGRKKSVRFGGDGSATPTSNELSVGNKGGNDSPANASRSNSVRKSNESSRKNSGSTAVASPRSVLKRSADAEEIRRFSKKMTQISLLLDRLRKGDTLTKYYEEGVTEARHFYVSDDGSELRWCKPMLKAISKKISNESRIILADVRGIVFGPRTERFEKYDWLKSQPYNCFSIVLEGRTLDIECKTREQFMVWFLGLQALCPLSHKFWNRGQLNWHRALYKTLQIAGNSNVDISTVWRDLVALSRKELAQKIDYEKRRSSATSIPNSPPSNSSSQRERGSDSGIASVAAIGHMLLSTGDDSLGKVVIREHLAKQAMSIIPSSSPVATPVASGAPSFKSLSSFSSAETSALEQKGMDSDDDAEELKSPKREIDMSIMTEPVNYAAHFKSKNSNSTINA